MKIITKGLFLNIAAFFLISSSSLQPIGTQISPAINLTGDDSGKPLSIVKGRVINLTLPDHVDGGYRFNKVQYDTTILKLENHSEKLPEANSPPGKSGIAVWQFIAINKGNTKLKLNASRPWKNGGTVTVFENNVFVK